MIFLSIKKIEEYYKKVFSIFMRFFIKKQVKNKKNKFMKIAIIGTGNIGGAVAKGLLKDHFAAQNLIIVDLNLSVLEEFKSLNNSLNTTTDAVWATSQADMVILAVKPWLVDTLLSQIQSSLTKDKIFVCIAAGVEFSMIKKHVNNGMPIFRVMPNTAMVIGESMTLISSEDATKDQENFVVELFNKLGKAVIIPEKMMGAATSVASCGIAYALRYLRAATEGAVELGFRADEAQQIVAQTMKGAAELILKNSESHAEVEIDKVCTPGGWTIKGLNKMEANGFSNAVIKGLKANN